MSQSLCEELVRRVDLAIMQAREEILHSALRKSA
jgi:hypothetical protein